MRDLQEVFDSFKMDIHLNNHKKWFTPILEAFIKHNYLEIAERRCLNYLPGHEPAMPAASLPVISSSTDISLPTPDTEASTLPVTQRFPVVGSLPTPSKVGGEGVQPAPLSGGADQSSPNSKIMQSPSPDSPVVNTISTIGWLEQSKAVYSEVVGDSYPGTLSETKAVLVGEEWPKECKVKVYGVCGNMRLMVGELEDGRRVSFWKGVRNWRINDWVPCRLDRGGGAPVYLPV